MEMTAGAASKGQGSPSSRRTPLDEEAAVGLGFLDGDDEGEKEVEDDPFHFSSTKNVPLDRLRRWRQAALVLNASRRFRYTLDLKREEEKSLTLRKIRAHAQAIRAAHIFQAAGTVKPPDGDFGIGQEQLVLITKDHNISALEEHGGVRGLADSLKANLENGIWGDDGDIQRRRNLFGSNTYP
ncbi:hypothetical protein MLD38_014177 [Melastoma candidum]|uniref:Uncharacterized protein n=1 Tax=Melastoma candidum TaxID=119954 RepID=A0ACB9RD90_9MYRT|nr:hypothetical protein MLD38_014177 [Melastoma candidum]